MASIAVPVTEIAFTTQPMQTPVWADVSAYVVSWSFTRGRQTELDTMAAGTYTCVLRNDDRRFDPSYTSGPYYGSLKRMRRLRQRAAYFDNTIDLFHGYIRSYTPFRDTDGRPYVQIVADDALRVLGMGELNGSFPLQRTDERVAAALDAVGWQTGTPWILGDATYSVLGTTTILAPYGDRALDVGLSQVQAVDLEAVNVLAHLQDVEYSENGLLFASKQGGITFHNRQRRLLAGSRASRATFGDLPYSPDVSTTELPYASVTVDYDDTRLWNDVRVTTTDGVEQVATDATSQAAHFTRVLRREVLVPTDGEAATIAGYLLSRYSDPPPRILTMTLDPQFGGGDLWNAVLEAELGDAYTVRHRPWLASGGGNLLEQVSLLEQITLAWDTEQALWSGAWGLSPADTNAYWVLGDGLLGTSTVLAL